MTLHPGQIVSPREPHPAGELFIVNNVLDAEYVTVRPFPADFVGGGCLMHVKGLSPIPALSIWQPWAWLIVRGFKDVENRGWAPKTPPRWLLIHAGKKKDFAGDYSVDILWERMGLHPKDVPGDDVATSVGGIVGIARLEWCTNGELISSPWAEPGAWHWHMADARPLPFCPCKGQQGLFYPAYDLGLLKKEDGR